MIRLAPVEPIPPWGGAQRFVTTSDLLFEFLIFQDTDVYNEIVNELMESCQYQ